MRTLTVRHHGNVGEQATTETGLTAPRRAKVTLATETALTAFTRAQSQQVICLA